MPEVFRYLSTKASVDPVKTLIVLPPEAQARTIEEVEEFAKSSGWVCQAERDAAALMVPVAKDGWAALGHDLPYGLYQEYRHSFMASKSAIEGRGGAVWMWETLIYVVGYEEGARLAAESMFARPGFAAATVLIDGVTDKFELLDEPSSHWLVENPSDYDLNNRDIPVACWLMGSDSGTDAFVRALRSVDNATAERTASYGGHETVVFEDSSHPVHQIRITPGLTGSDPAIAQLAMDEFFDTIIRWKNGPDGSLKMHITKEAFYADGTYEHGSVDCDDVEYHYAVYLPKGMTREEARGLPLVFSVHGRGEPTWIFCQKNGWEELADDTREFVVVLPDSPGNTWNVNRDANAFELITTQVLRDYGLDPERVYLTGFSNGAVFTFQMATYRPQLFAAASPWNGPASTGALKVSGFGDFILCESFSGSGYEMPLWVYYGDSDNKVAAEKTETFLAISAANGCSFEPMATWDGTNHYCEDAGYVEGGRFTTELYANDQGTIMVGYTLIKNMPHGAIADEALATWEFVKQFRRPAGSKRVEVIS